MRTGSAPDRVGKCKALCVLLILLGPFVLTATAATVVLRMRAINPSPTEKKTVEVQGALPWPAGSNDLVEAAGFDVVYDVGSKARYVRRKVELAPGEVKTFEVALRDIWIVSSEKLQELSEHAKALSVSLAGTEQADVGERLRGVIDENMRAVRQRQDASAMGVASAADHIYAYEVNSRAVEQTRKDLGMLENLVIAAGKDPRKILGASQAAPPPPTASGGATGETLVVRLRVTNPLLIKKKRDIRYDLPDEVKPTDIVDAAGLKTGFDPARKVSYVYADEMEFGPQESKDFAVRIRNPWGGVKEKTAQLISRVEKLGSLTDKEEVYASVKADVKSVLDDLSALQKRELPAEVNDQYVAVARQQFEDLRAMEGRVMRIEELFRQNPPTIFGAPMLKMQPPSRETTWMIIYIILGFLGVLSLLFFLRWYGRSKAEQLTRGPAASGDSSDTGGAASEKAPPGGASAA